MTTAPTPEEVRALAERLEHCVAKWGKQNALSLEAYSAVKMMRRMQASYQALQTENERLRMELVAEASAAAKQKLRADQLAQQHRMQAQMHAQATQQLAELEARKPLPLSDDDRLRLRSDVARAIWDVMREHEDRCDHALEDVEHKHQVWDCADAAIETALGIIPRPNPLIASREVVADGPLRVTRLHLTEEGRAGLTSKATGPLPGITGGSS